jgi:protocatechuate 3,4-dioxygenase beta subunit
MALNRRLFLVTSAGAAIGRSLLAARQNGLDAFGGDTLPCVLDVRATPPVSADGNYRPGAPVRTSIVEPAQKGVPIQLSGIVAGLACGPIAGATLEFWQPDAAGVFDTRGFSLRGRQVTGAGGRYRMTTIVPGGSGNRAPSIGVHVVVEKKAELWTAMFFPGQTANARDPRFKEELLVKLGGSEAKRTGSFDIRLNL